MCVYRIHAEQRPGQSAHVCACALAHAPGPSAEQRPGQSAHVCACAWAHAPGPSAEQRPGQSAHVCACAWAHAPGPSAEQRPGQRQVPARTPRVHLQSRGRGRGSDCCRTPVCSDLSEKTRHAMRKHAPAMPRGTWTRPRAHREHCPPCAPRGASRARRRSQTSPAAARTPDLFFLVRRDFGGKR
jgi:hypothetical protein